MTNNVIVGGEMDSNNAPPAEYDHEAPTAVYDY